MAMISVEVPDDLARRLSEQARASGMSDEDIVLRALRTGLDGADALEAWIAEGEADAAAGRTVSLDQAMARADAIIAEARRTSRD